MHRKEKQYKKNRLHNNVSSELSTLFDLNTQNMNKPSQM